MPAPGRCRVAVAVPDEADVLAGTTAGKMYRVLLDDMSFVEVAASHATQSVLLSGVGRHAFSVGGVINVRDLSTTRRGTTGGVSRRRHSLLSRRQQLADGWKEGAVECHTSASIAQGHSTIKNGVAVGKPRRYRDGRRR